MTNKHNNKGSLVRSPSNLIPSFQEQIEEGSAILEEANAALLPDPVIVRGAGNITV
jgi:hypothetical protein